MKVVPINIQHRAWDVVTGNDTYLFDLGFYHYEEREEGTDRDALPKLVHSDDPPQGDLDYFRVLIVNTHENRGTPMTKKRARAYLKSVNESTWRTMASQEEIDGCHMVKVFEEDDMNMNDWMLHMDCDCVGCCVKTTCTHQAVVGHWWNVDGAAHKGWARTHNC